MDNRQIKDALYAQVSRIGKAISSPKRLELIEILCQGEKSVEQLADEAEISVKLTSAHLKELRIAQLVEAQREGKNMYYRLSAHAVADFWVAVRSLAEDRLVELRVALAQLAQYPDELSPMGRKELLAQAKRGEVVVVDVRPESEFAASHLPFAMSMPLPELRKHLDELPRDKPVVAYCRGPFCLMAKEAVELLRSVGIQAMRMEEGVAEWRAANLPISTETR
jgi:rhodanese-related sulfurtransferase/DNA-binding transcriptional ArsR family regulator